jgi:fimbrial chaperone protein
MLFGRGVAATWFFVAAFGVMGLPAAVRAQSISVQPVTLQLAPGQMSATVKVTNDGDNPTGLQVRAFAWRQQDGQDDLTPSGEILASPPLTTLEPKATQIVRLLLRRPPNPTRESTYRLLIDQIPTGRPNVGGISLAIRLSLPIFASAAETPPAHLAFHVELNKGGNFLVFSNDGGKHEAVRDIVLISGDGHKLKIENASAYVLPGSTRRWRIVTPGSFSPSGNWRLAAHVISGDIDQSVPVVVHP